MNYLKKNIPPNEKGDYPILFSTQFGLKLSDKDPHMLS